MLSFLPSPRGIRKGLVTFSRENPLRFTMLRTEPSALSLKRRVFGASLWSMAGFALSYVVRLGSSLLMTRLLVPEMFGVMSIAMTLMTGLAMFSDLGLRPSIIQNPRGGDPAFLNTAWLIQIFRGLLLFGMGLCISLFILAAIHFGLVPRNSVYADPLLPSVVGAISLSTLITGFQSTKFAEASRELSLGRVTQVRMAAQIAGLICMIGWALADRSIWALVAGSLCASLVTTVLSHIWLPGVSNRWQWDRTAFHELFHFGKWIFVSSILGFFANNADRVMLGGVVDSSTLGVYSIAYTICDAVIQILNKLISEVSYSAFSELARERSEELKRNYYRIHFVTASFAYFCSGALIVSGQSLIRVLYDPRYEQAGWMLAILAVGLLAVPSNLSMYCLLARGLPKLFSTLVAIRVASAILILIGFFTFGVSGALWGIALSRLSLVPFTIYYQVKFRLFDLSKELLLLPTFFLGLLVGSGFTVLVRYYAI
jgi:O-antigen/teichoic acid export membrane protein